jgi:hypothetical protein
MGKPTKVHVVVARAVLADLVRRDALMERILRTAVGESFKRDRFLRHGIATFVTDDANLAELRAFPGVESVEVDSLKTTRNDAR